MGKYAINCSDHEPLTQQSSKDECDINLIVERAKRGAVVEHVRNAAPMYGDFTSIPTDLRDCLNVVRQANELFMSMDAFVRRRFDNDPAKLLDFLNDPANRDEAVKLGLVKAPPEPAVEPDELKVLKSIDASLKGKKKGVGVQDTGAEGQ